MTVGKLADAGLLDKAFDDVNQCNTMFHAVVGKISVEMIGRNEEFNFKNC